jgi:Flp pilus assembly protein TadG
MFRISKAHNSKIADETGTAMVELALVLPILVALIFGALDLGRAYNYWIDQTHLANEGARLAAVGKSPSGVLAHASSRELKSGSDSVVQAAALSYSCSGNKIGDDVTVVVTSKYHFFPFVHAVNATITGKATMRLEQTPPPGGAGC